eukprot:SAG31_NODE_4596_length_3105_cov_4.885562_4_plen_104_part_00
MLLQACQQLATRSVRLTRYHLLQATRVRQSGPAYQQRTAQCRQAPGQFESYVVMIQVHGTTRLLLLPLPLEVRPAAPWHVPAGRVAGMNWRRAAATTRGAGSG